jgi:dTDP-3,4-didehydro-2,6-dideoxy-alpha-D-glucose 3-reductase
MQNKLRIGILGAAQIASRSMIEPAKKIDRIEIIGVAASQPERAKQYAEKYKIPTYYKDYKTLVESDEIDVVYIALANHLHYEWIIRAAENKKHILVEKPICLKNSDFNPIENAVKNNGVSILETAMVQHHPFYKKVSEIIHSGTYGNLKSIETYMHYPFNIENNYRASLAMGGGVFWDEAVYWLQFTQACRELNPVSVRGESDFSGPNDIDLSFKAYLNFDDDVISFLSCSYELPYKYDHWVILEKAKLRIRNFLRPALGNYKLVIDIQDFDGSLIDKIEFLPQNYYENQLDFFTKVIHGEKVGIPLKESFQRIYLMEEIYSCTLKYHIKHGPSGISASYHIDPEQ